MSTLSAIAVESYKKYILVSLIRLGQVCFITIFNLLFTGEISLFPYTWLISKSGVPLEGSLRGLFDLFSV